MKYMWFFLAFYFQEIMPNQSVKTTQKDNLILNANAQTPANFNCQSLLAFGICE